MDVHRVSNLQKSRAQDPKILDEGDRLISRIKQYLHTYNTSNFDEEAPKLTNLKDAGIELSKLIEYAQELIVTRSLLSHQEMIERDMTPLQWKNSEEIVYSGRNRQLDLAFKNFSIRVDGLKNRMGELKWD